MRLDELALELGGLEPDARALGHHVIRDLVAVAHHALDQGLVPLDATPDHEEGRAHAVLLEQVEDGGRRRGVRAVVDREGDDGLGGLDVVDDVGMALGELLDQPAHAPARVAGCCEPEGEAEAQGEAEPGPGSDRPPRCQRHLSHEWMRRRV
jgi:hypothetical protein